MKSNITISGMPAPPNINVYIDTSYGYEIIPIPQSGTQKVGKKQISNYVMQYEDVYLDSVICTRTEIEHKLCQPSEIQNIWLQETRVYKIPNISSPVYAYFIYPCENNDVIKESQELIQHPTWIPSRIIIFFMDKDVFNVVYPDFKVLYINERNKRILKLCNIQKFIEFSPDRVGTQYMFIPIILKQHYIYVVQNQKIFQLDDSQLDILQPLQIIDVVQNGVDGKPYIIDYIYKTGEMIHKVSYGNRIMLLKKDVMFSQLCAMFSFIHPVQFDNNMHHKGIIVLEGKDYSQTLKHVVGGL